MILVCAALKEEIDGLDHEHVLITGVGKVNAAVSLTKYLSGYVGMIEGVDCVVNLGTAAARQMRGIYQVSGFEQRDFEAPDIFGGNKMIDIKTIGSFRSSLCSTGDTFATPDQMFNYSLVDMEGYALAKVCRVMTVPLISLKYVSDAGDFDEWQKSLPEASKHLIEGFEKLKGLLAP